MSIDLTSLTGSTRFEAMQREIRELRNNAETAPPTRMPKPDIAAVEQRISVITNETNPKDARMAANEITKVGGTTPLPEKAQRAGLMPGRIYASIDRGDVYAQDNRRRSYFADMARSRFDPEAAERLRKNSQLRADNDRKNGVVTSRAISTSDGAGGEFVPPLWLEEQFVQVARPGRVTADLCVKEPVPAGTDSLNIPKIGTGTAVAFQVGQNVAIEQQDITTTSVASAIATIAGGQTVSLQLIEQSPLNIDGVILSDLARAYAVAVNQTVLTGAGSSGVPLGILSMSGINTATYTAGTITGANSLYTGLVNGIAAIQSSRYDRPTAIVTHPNTWATLLAAVDGQDRPIVVPAPSQAMNAFGTALVLPPAQGMVGYLGGLPVYLDSVMPYANGQYLIGKFDDAFLWESDIRAEAFEQTYAQNMSVFVRLYNYISFQPQRYPQSFTAVSHS